MGSVNLPRGGYALPFFYLPTFMAGLRHRLQFIDYIAQKAVKQKEPWPVPAVYLKIIERKPEISINTACIRFFCHTIFLFLHWFLTNFYLLTRYNYDCIKEWLM